MENLRDRTRREAESTRKYAVQVLQFCPGAQSKLGNVESPSTILVNLETFPTTTQKLVSSEILHHFFVSRYTSIAKKPNFKIFITDQCSHVWSVQPLRYCMVNEASTLASLL